ncbi:MAG TPA: hypothetical protein VFY21_06230 [Xanthobacteraceae bacterium]|nr:hypothetical protein [Xanthobacteraceae bacterium]
MVANALRPHRFLSIAAAILSAAMPLAASAADRPRVYTNEQYIDELTRPTSVPLDDPKAMLAFILESIPDRVNVYPTENYYYFYFHHRGTRYAGNIRLDAKDRDEGKLHFAYFVELTEWVKDDAITYRVFGKEDGVAVERIEPLRYRVTLGSRSVIFQLNDLSKVVPPKTALGPDDQYLGPVFDESGIRFFLVFNRKLRIFHYVLDETVPVADELFPAQFTNRILIGRRTGYAFYDEHRLKRKILIGVFEANSSVNNAFDGPFDQLPDNFIKGDELREAIIAADPTQAGRIDRHGGSEDGSSRYLIGPYTYYRSEQDLMPFHECATDKKLPRELYWACFVIREGGEDENEDDTDGGAAEEKKDGKTAPAAVAPAGKTGKRP